MTDDEPLFTAAWVAEGTPWGPELAAIEDLDIYAIEIAHAENECPTLRLDVENPRVGLLAAGRNVWLWLTWHTEAGELVPLFYGRLVGVPEALVDEIVRLMFIARPPDYLEQKAALAATLRVLPWWDPIWLQDSIEDPDTVLEPYTLDWHIDRITHQVSVSDLAVGEDGTITLTQDDHIYDGLSVAIAGAPLVRIKGTLTVTWPQEGTGDVDITENLWKAFGASGSAFQFPVVGSFTGGGLLSSWPAAGSSIGGGWEMAPTAHAEAATFLQSKGYAVKYVQKTDDPDTETRFTNLKLSLAADALAGFKNYDVLFELAPIAQQFVVRYATSRPRTEILTFTLEADVQSIITDPEESHEDVVTLSSALVGEAVDPDGALPIGSLARNMFFPTDRGQLAMQYGLLLARAKLVSHARAVNITVQPSSWDQVAALLSCRMNLIVEDDRLPAGQAGGKIIAYKLSSDGEGAQMESEVTIGCMVGYGIALPANPEPADSYADDYSDNYDELEPGAKIEVLPGALRYEALDGTIVIDDDGLDLLNMTPERIIQSIVIEGGVDDQKAAIDAGKKAGDPLGALKLLPTRVTVNLVPVTGASFETDFEIILDKLVIPQTVNLEAPPL